MAKTSKEKSPHPFRENIEVVIFAVVMAMGLKVFAVEAYQIPTGSMQPTLMGTDLHDAVSRAKDGGLHDRVLVDKISYLFRDPARWEVVVFRYPLLTHNNYVKRLVGMGGEQMMIVDGNIWSRPIGSDEDFQISRKPWKVQDAIWKQVSPSPADEPARWTGWSPSGAFDRLQTGLMKLHGKSRVRRASKVRDGYTDGYPEAIYWRVPTVPGSGQEIVNDVRVAFDLIPEGPKGSFVADYVFGLHTVKLQIEADGGWKLDLPDGSSMEGLATLEEGQPTRFDFAFWDQSVRMQVDGEEPQTAELKLGQEASNRNSIEFSTEAGGWALHPIDVWRDIHYLPPRQGAAPVFDIPEGYYFMMGDNTQNSLDSRDWVAEVLTVDGEDGPVELRGDSMASGADPRFDNPRWSRGEDGEREWMTFRDEFGGLHVLSTDEVADSESRRVAWPLVPRNYVLGRALAVFQPIPPFAPVVRIGLVQ